MKPDMTDRMEQPAQAEEHGRRHYVVLGLAIVLLAAAIFFGPSLREQEPDFYDPARIALVNARQRFEESLGHEQALVEQLQMAHAELESAIGQLEMVANLDPAHRTRIESLRASLRTIENSDRSGNTDPELLQQSYRDLLTQMDELIGEMDERARQQ